MGMCRGRGVQLNEESALTVLACSIGEEQVFSPHL